MTHLELLNAIVRARGSFFWVLEENSAADVRFLFDARRHFISVARAVVESATESAEHRQQVVASSLRKKPLADRSLIAMRITIVQSPRIDDVDGIDLRRFLRGQKYDVGHHLAELLLAEGWAVPAADDEPALVIPFSEAASFLDRFGRGARRNPRRETHPPHPRPVAQAADVRRRKRQRQR